MPVHMPAACRPSSAAFMETCHQYSTGGMPAKYQHDTRNMPASCQDWDGRLCYNPCGTEHVDRIMALWIGCSRVRVLWRTARALEQIRLEIDVALGGARPSRDA